MTPTEPVSPNGPEIDDVLARAGQQWRAAQPPPPPVRLRTDGATQDGRTAVGRWPALRRWAPIAALASVLAVIGGATLPGLLRDGTPPGLTTGSTGPSTTGATAAPGFATLPPDPGNGVAVRGTGVLYRAKQGGDVRLCGEVWATLDLPGSTAGCGPISVAVTNLTGKWLTHTTVNGQAYSDAVSVTGTYHDGVLALDTVVAAVATPNATAGSDVTMPPCPAPAGGWPLGYGAGNGDTNALIEYVRSHDDLFNDIWEAHPSGISGPSYQPVSMVYVVGTTGDVDADRAHLATLYPGSLCVHKVKHSAADLNEIAERLKGVSSVAIDAAADPTEDRVRVTVLVLDQHTAAVIKEIGGDAVVLNPPLLQYNG